MYLYFITILCFMKDRSNNMLEGNLKQERDPKLDIDKDLRLFDNRRNHRKDTLNDNIECRGGS